MELVSCIIIELTTSQQPKMDCGDALQKETPHSLKSLLPSRYKIGTKLSEKLEQRLSPWYVRHKDVIATVVAVLGCISGLITTISSLRVHKP